MTDEERAKRVAKYDRVLARIDLAHDFLLAALFVALFFVVVELISTRLV
jgi:hypothetical protein